MSLPYENATSGKSALNEMQKILRGLGASSFGAMEDFDKGEVLVQFQYRGRSVQIIASSKGYAAAWLRLHPYGPRTRGTKQNHERKALAIGQVAVYSILRDWIKGQITAIEVGTLTFEGAFLGQLLLANGQTVLQRVIETKLLAIPPPA